MLATSMETILGIDLGGTEIKCVAVRPDGETVQQSTLPTRDGEFVVTHSRNSVLHGCSVPDVLTGLGAEHLIFSGVSTACVVEGSVRHATDIGYPCTVVGDACSTATQEQHFNALHAMKLLADVIDVEECLATLGVVA